MFNRLYLGEVKKLLRPRTLIVLAIVIVLFLTIYAITYEKMIEFSETALPHTEGEAPEIEEIIESSFHQNTITVSAENIDEMIAVARQALIDVEEDAKADSRYLRSPVDAVYQVKAGLKALEYIKKHEIYGEEIVLYSNMNIFSDKSAEGFMKSMFEILLTVMIFYGIIIGAGSYAQEMKTGTLKMLFMRPITPTKLTSAKLLAMFTMATAILLVVSLLAYFYGLIRFGAASTQRILVVFNASGAFMSTKSLMLFASMMFGVLQVFSFTAFSFAVGSLTRNRVLATILGIIIHTGLPAMLLQFLKMGRFLFTTSMGFGGFFGISGAVPAGSNFFIALPVYLAYMALFIVPTYIIINKRDLA